MTKLTRLLACMHVLQTYKCGNQSKMHVLQQKDRQHMHYRGTKGGKEQKKETDRALVHEKGNTARKQAQCWGTERVSKNEIEVASRAAPSTASEKLHTGVPGP